MSKIEVKNVQGKAVETLEFSDGVFGIEPNIPVVHHVVVAYEATLRQGTHSTKNRSAVSGGGASPTDKKVPAVLVRAPYVPHSGLAVASFSARCPAVTPSVPTTRRRSSP